MIVTLDGPGGTGKSSASRELARRLDLPHLDTGAYYRAATLAALRAGIDPEDGDSTTECLTQLDLDQQEGRMFLNGEDVSDEIRSDAVTAAVSAVSRHPSVRERLVDLQRAWVMERSERAVVEGRDIGSVVFPDADVKIYLDARPEVRARRRSAESGEPFADVLADLRRRDALDSSRANSPLRVPEGAVVVDTSEMSLDAVVEALLELVDAKS